VVVEGPERGAHFPLDQPDILLGRGEPSEHRPSDILLDDHSVSSRHAIFTVGARRLTLRHLPSATNPTLVNGRPIKSKQVKAGDQIAIGLVTMELRERQADPAALDAATAGTLTAGAPSEDRDALEQTRIITSEDAGTPTRTVDPTRVLEDPLPNVADAAENPPTVVLSTPEEPIAGSDRTVSATLVANGRIDPDCVTGSGRLMLTRGIPGWAGRRFELAPRRTGIGRSEDCDIALPIAAISRHHAALVWEGSRLVLLHESTVNPTYVNGSVVENRKPLSHGDEIGLADGVTFYLILDPTATARDSDTRPELGDAGPADPTAATQVASLPTGPPEPAGAVVMTSSAPEPREHNGVPEESKGHS
jgi:pSer/pThr/pTyr-binding forkhead associated (FHA) protein